MHRKPSMAATSTMVAVGWIYILSCHRRLQPAAIQYRQHLSAREGRIQEQFFFFGGGGLNYAVCSTSSHLGAFSLSFMVKKIEGSAPEVSMGLVGVGGT